MSGELPRSVLDVMYAHALKGYPEEICGLVIADDEARPCDNRQNALHAEDPATFPRDARTAYNLGPQDLFFLDKSLRPSSTRKVTAIYHSHCNVGAYFSDEDVRAATLDGEPLYPVDYIVLDAQADGVRGAVRFRWDGSKFAEVARYGP